mmetsp:Transcript_58116/g.168704  ORF Transcript_58116/g.168704 Transcript_58116/m.168704 type:complete len:238 (-) Transcript_58116:8-721(-)
MQQGATPSVSAIEGDGRRAARGAQDLDARFFVAPHRRLHEGLPTAACQVRCGQVLLHPGICPPAAGSVDHDGDDEGLEDGHNGMPTAPRGLGVNVGVPSDPRARSSMRERSWPPRRTRRPKGFGHWRVLCRRRCAGGRLRLGRGAALRIAMAACRGRAGRNLRRRRNGTRRLPSGGLRHGAPLQQHELLDIAVGSVRGGRRPGDGDDGRAQEDREGHFRKSDVRYANGSVGWCGRHG